MRADYIESLPPGGILDREEIDARRYRGMNPAFVRQVWAKRRKQASVRSEGVRRPNGSVATKWPPERKAFLAELLMAGLSSGQIAERLNTTPNAITGIVHKDYELRAIGFQTPYAKKLRGEL